MVSAPRDGGKAAIGRGDTVIRSPGHDRAIFFEAQAVQLARCDGDKAIRVGDIALAPAIPSPSRDGAIIF